MTGGNSCHYEHESSCCVGGNNVGASHVGVMLVFVVLFCGSHVGVGHVVGHESQINFGLVVLWCWIFCFFVSHVSEGIAVNIV